MFFTGYGALESLADNGVAVSGGMDYPNVHYDSILYKFFNGRQWGN